MHIRCARVLWLWADGRYPRQARVSVDHRCNQPGTGPGWSAAETREIRGTLLQAHRARHYHGNAVLMRCARLSAFTRHQFMSSRLLRPTPVRRRSHFLAQASTSCMYVCMCVTQVVYEIPSPGPVARLEILKYHARNKKVSSDSMLQRVAEVTKVSCSTYTDTGTLTHTHTHTHAYHSTS